MNVFTLRREHKIRLLFLTGITFLAYLFFSQIGFFRSFKLQKVFFISIFRKDVAHFDRQPLYEPENEFDLQEDVNIKELTKPVTPQGLVARKRSFYLNNQRMYIYSGALHYFRVVPEYWRDRLLKLKACGLNTVETYVPWNLHEETKGTFNFEGLLDLRMFIKMAQDVGLYVIFRPGPYICSEWDLGGLPSWLLHDPKMKLRSTYQPFLDAVDAYFRHLIPLVADLQYTKGGPIIAFQIENEYGSYGRDQKYMKAIKELLEQHGVVELMFTSDNDQGIDKGSMPGVLATANLKSMDWFIRMKAKLKSRQPDKPFMVMEFWTGWFDHWGEKHHTWNSTEYEKVLREIVASGGSVNLYMFHGGTNFGFMNGANYPYAPTVTSYDYDAILTESGGLTSKFQKTRDVLRKYAPKGQVPKNLPTPLDPPSTFAYGMLTVVAHLNLEAILSEAKVIKSYDVMAMELLNANEGSGQGYGFILYRNKINSGRKLRLAGKVTDRAQILIDGRQIATYDWTDKDRSIDLAGVKSSTNLDILVENLGRVNYGKALDFQRKGLTRDVYLDNNKLVNWEIYPLEFKSIFISSILSSKAWQSSLPLGNPPGFYKVLLQISGIPRDTFISMQILIFELHKPNVHVILQDKPVLG
ncbi:unnamed protein product [Owenia fusiformis]|uniref:Beta-galactosidase n=1 Tax=Owenia fusiformis TaxID=6347 RepID=A0A8J1TY89_OWEFU|nr:unnamed protein product [Owenia fusiformis]